MEKLRIVLLVCLSVLMAYAVNAQSPNMRLSVHEAKTLVEAAIYPNKANAELDQASSSYDPDFIIFEAVDPNPNHNGDMGFFAVNAWTGDVWSTAGSCSRRTSSRLIVMLKNIQARSKLTAVAFHKWHVQKPLCDLD